MYWITLDLGERLNHRLDAELAARGLAFQRGAAGAKPPPNTVVAWLQDHLDRELWAMPSLRWAHIGHAGIEHSLFPGIWREDLWITSASGRSTHALAEHAIYLMMAVSYASEELRVYRRWRLYRAPPPTRRRALYGRTVGIVGAGHVGSQLAVLCRSLGMTVLAYRRRPLPFVSAVEQGYVGRETWPEFLARCEFLVLAASLNDGSAGLVDRAAFAAMPRGAVLVNIARGGLVDESALLDALDSGQLGGAGLDVQAEEPMSVWSPLWSHRRVVLSPHSVPRQKDRDERHCAMLVANLARFVVGQPLLNAIGADDVYSPPPVRRAGLGERLWNRLAPRLLPRFQD